MGEVIARDAIRDPESADFSALQQENFALRQELRLLRIANEELERLAVRDTLTPLYNRRHFITSLSDRIDRLERYGTAAALVFVDVDQMKRINDNFGHSAGDFALNHVARLLSRAIRSTDIAARVGGDEFALLLDGLDEAAAQDKANDLASLIARSGCRFGDQVLPLTASFGCTALKPDDSDFAAIARADLAMYAAKRQINRHVI